MDLEPDDGHLPRSHPPDGAAAPVSDTASKTGGRGPRHGSRKRPPPAPKTPGRLARKRQLRRQWNPAPAGHAPAGHAPSASPAALASEATGTPRPEAGADLPGPHGGTLTAGDGDRTALAEAIPSDAPPTPRPIDGPADRDAPPMDHPVPTREAAAHPPEPSGRPGGEEAKTLPVSNPAPVRRNRRPALAASIVVALVGAGLVLGRRDEPAPGPVANGPGPTTMSAQPDAVGHGPRAWSDLPRPTDIEPAEKVRAGTVAAGTEASRIEPSGLAAADARPAEVVAGLEPEPASRLVAPPVTRAAPQPPSGPTGASPPHATETVFPAVAGLVPPNEAPTIDPGGIRAGTVTVPLPPRRPASFQRPRALAALSPGAGPPSQKPEPSDAIGPEEYSAFAARRHEPGSYRIRWGVARLRESANDDSARGPSWDFPPDQ